MQDQSRHAVRPYESADPLSHRLMSTLSEAQRNTLAESYLRGQLDLERKSQEMARDVHMFGETIRQMAATTQAAAESGAAATVQHSHQWSIGKTEAIIGNTEQARSGRLTRTMGDHVPGWMYVLGAIVILLLASMLLHH